jgi:uridine kinase
MIGDSSSDILAAKRSGLRSILVETGAGGRDGKYHVIPDYTAADLWEAVSLILDVHPTLLELARKATRRIQPGDFIFIGGLSRSGKSSFAAAITEVLRERGIGSTIIAMDRWILSQENRGGTVMERYDIAAVRSLLGRLAEPDPIQTIQTPSYDPLARKSTPDADTVTIPPNAVRIVDGVTALHLAGTTPSDRTHTVFVSIDEDRRKSRVVREYLRRKMSVGEAEGVYQARQIDEAPFVVETQTIANQTILIPLTTSQP